MKAQGWFFYAVFFLLILALAFLPPMLRHEGYVTSSELAYSLFSPLCHQLPERSFEVFGYKFGVCARCAGIYFGLLMGSIMFPFLNPGSNVPGRNLLLISLAPMLLDGFTQLLGFRESTNVLRLLTGFLFGVVFPQYLIPATEKALGEDSFFKPWVNYLKSINGGSKWQKKRSKNQRKRKPLK